MARRKVAFAPKAKATRIPQGFTILGFGQLHFLLDEGIVRCLGSQLRLDVTTPTVVVRRSRIDGCQQGRKIEILPKAQGAVLVKISSCAKAALFGHDDNESIVRERVRAERWETIGQYLVKDGLIEEYQPKRR